MLFLTKSSYTQKDMVYLLQGRHSNLRYFLRKKRRHNNACRLKGLEIETHSPEQHGHPGPCCV